MELGEEAGEPGFSPTSSVMDRLNYRHDREVDRWEMSILRKVLEL